jgi:hypothetical protein
VRRRLRQGVPPHPSHRGRPREAVFATFDETPIGCASIGQAHRATLKSNGRRVVVKVQNPEAERTFYGDVLALRLVVDTFMPQLSIAFEEAGALRLSFFFDNPGCYNRRAPSACLFFL